MTRPTRYFVREWTPDPHEQEPDSETDTDVPDARNARVAYALARQDAARLRACGRLAGAFERRNIRVPEECPITDPPAHLWEYESVQIDEDVIEREDERTNTLMGERIMYEVARHDHGKEMIGGGINNPCGGLLAARHRWTKITPRPVGLARAKTCGV